MASRVRVVGPDMKRVNAQLKSLAPECRKELVKELRRAAEPAAAAARRAVLATPSKGGNQQLTAVYSARGRGKSEKRAARNGTGLRAQIARATKVTISPAAGRVTIVVDRAQMDRSQRTLPEYVEGARRPWRHPTHGHADRFVTQQSRPYFVRTIRQFRAQFNTVATKAMQSAARKAGFH